MIKKIKIEEAVALTQQADSKCINTEVTQHGYCDTWIVNFLDVNCLNEYYRFSMYISKYNSWHGVNPPYTELTKVKLVEKIVVTTEWVECE